jgi:hypothetical protein
MAWRSATSGDPRDAAVDQAVGADADALMTEARVT